MTTGKSQNQACATLGRGCPLCECTGSTPAQVRSSMVAATLSGADGTGTTGARKAGHLEGSLRLSPRSMPCLYRLLLRNLVW